MMSFQKVAVLNLIYVHIMRSWLGAETSSIQNGMLNMTIENLS